MVPPADRTAPRPLVTLAAVLVTTLSLALAAGRVRADGLSAGDAAFLHGRYDEAELDYAGVHGAGQPRATLRLARLNIRRGRYLAAASGAKIAAAADASLAPEAREIQGEALRLAGRLPEAQKLLEELVSSDATQYRARWQLGLLYTETGQKAKADEVWNAFYDDYNGGTIDRKNGEQLFYVAEAARGLGGYEDANDTFRDAVAAAPGLLEADVAWGDLFLDKYAAPEARKSFEEVVKTDPDEPDALAGLAEVVIDEDYDVIKAQKLLAHALAGNPREVRAVALHARLLIDDQNWATADAYLAPLITENPTVSRWLALSATARYFLGDRAGFAERERQALALDPRDASFYHTVADFCVNEHRYPEAQDFDARALALDGKDAAALAGLGQSYLRLGDESQGYDYLKRAWAVDKYNVRTYNLLNLYDDVIAKKYVRFTASPHFRLLVPSAERAILARYIPRQAEEEWKLLSAKYGFTPDNPVSMELFNDPSAYAVRTVGVPGLGALGVCFGKVITAISPSTGNLNWGMILWHEEAHVFAIQLSRGRVPRWFTEGLSEYESRIERKEWHRTNDFDLYAGMKSGRMVGLAALNGTFTHAKSMADMTLAYQQSSLTVDYLARTYGFPKIVQALRMFAAGKQTPEVLKAITGLSLADLDRAFRADLRARLAVYDGQWYVHPMDYDDADARRKAAEAAPGDSYAQAALAVALLVQGDAAGAKAQADKALALEPGQREALYVEGVLAMDKDHDGDAARADFEKILALGANGYELHQRLCEIAAAQGDLPTAEAQCSAAKKLDPEREDPYLTLAAVYDKLGRADDEEAQLEPVAYMDPMGWDTYSRLVNINGKAKRWGKVREFGEMALHVNPFDASLHYYLGAAYVDAKRWEDAVFEEQSALLCAPKNPAAVEVALADAYLGNGDKDSAREAIAKALAADASNADAKTLAAKLK